MNVFKKFSCSPGADEIGSYNLFRCTWLFLAVFHFLNVIFRDSYIEILMRHTTRVVCHFCGPTTSKAQDLLHPLFCLCFLNLSNWYMTLGSWELPVLAKPVLKVFRLKFSKQHALELELFKTIVGELYQCVASHVQSGVCFPCETAGVMMPSLSCREPIYECV